MHDSLALRVAAGVLTTLVWLYSGYRLLTQTEDDQK